MKYYDPFILPFTIGLYFIFTFLVVKYAIWIFRLPKPDLQKIGKGFFTVKTFSAAKEVFMESLLHRKVFKVNPVLGYMHMSLAMGWFLLILFGKIGTLSFTQDFFNPLHYAIFFKFFEPQDPHFFYSKTYCFLMDTFLLFILTGVGLAVFKRFRSKVFGLKKTTKTRLGDKFALSALWLIFPFRLLAESFTSGLHHSGHYLTGNLGIFFAGFLPLEILVYPSWWAYSLALGVFFVALPFSRYMHIPTEMFLIFLRNYGIKTGNEFSSFSKAEILSCPRCGICIDKCQLTVAGCENAQPVYFLQDVRNNELTPDLAMNCLQCGRCEEFCPVGIDIKKLRLIPRKELTSDNADFGYLPAAETRKADVVFFAGCMTHLTPGIKKAMKNILVQAKTNYWFLDEDGGVCCGRPLILAGETDSARQLIDYNRKLIFDSGAKTLVTSCPICLKVFKKEYDLDIEILHHSEFILRLVELGQIRLKKQLTRVAYHDPCELGRGSGIYDEPRNLIKKTGTLVGSETEREQSLCCGNSLGSFRLSAAQANLIMKDALDSLTTGNPDILATSCPLCKKTFSKAGKIPVKDIAEITSEAICSNQDSMPEKKDFLAKNKDFDECCVCELEEEII